MKLAFILSWRYFKTSVAEKSIATMLKFVFWAIFTSTFGLALVAGIMRGIEKATHDKLRGIHAQISLRSYGNALNSQALSEVLTKEFPEIKAMSLSTMKQIIVYNDALQEHQALFLKAIDPVAEEKVTNFNTKITQGPRNLSEAFAQKSIIIGEALANNLQCSMGDPITLLTATNTINNQQVTFKKYTAQIGAIFKTGIDEFDSSLAVCDHALFFALFPEEGYTELNICLHDNAQEESIINQLKKRFPVEVYSWKDLYPALIAALKLEKYAMNCILALFILIASISTISLVFMHIVQKHIDIALLRAMGMHYRSLQTIFLIMTMSITLVACSCGLIAAGIVGSLLQSYPWIELPDVYYVSTLPFMHEISTYSIIFVVTMIISLLATLVPLKKIKSLALANVLRSGI